MSIQSTAKSLFPGFSKLRPNIWYYRPGTDAINGAASTPAQPDLIILSTWMAAAPKHILKYVAGHQSMFPRSPILMLTNSLKDISFRPAGFHEKNLKPAIDIIHETSTSRNNARILLHLFSNGGAHHAAQLAFEYQRQFEAPLPITGMILDSAPGRATYGRAIKALTIGLPKFFLFRWIGLVVIHFMVITMWIRHHILKIENVIATVRRQLIDPEFFPTSAPRVYIYSKADEMVGWEHVEWAVKQARQNGYSVRTERYENSPHVGHLMKDPERYWDAVRSVASPDTSAPLPLQ